MSLIRASRSLLRSGGVAASRAASTALRTDASVALPSYLLNAPATEVTRLPNGVRVATESGYGETATVGVFIDAGSRYETAANNGTAHFLEHLTFKGTSRMSQYDVEVEFENMGGHLNAYTSREHTVYYAKVFKQDVGKATQILADMLTQPQLDEGAIERERSVILREAEEVATQQEEVIFDLLHETAFQGSGLGRTILGPAENIKSIGKRELQDYIRTHYTGGRIVVAGAGGIDHGALVEMAQKAFGGLPATPATGIAAPRDSATFLGSSISQRNDDLGLAHLAVAFGTGGWTDAHAMPLMVANALLGSWDRTQGAGGNVASALCRKVADDALAHSVSAFHTTYTDTGLFGVYAVAEPTKVWELSAAVMYELVRLAHNVTPEELARAKTQLKTNLLGSLDGSTAVCEDIGRQMLTYGRRLTPAEIVARVDAVDADAIYAAANAYINDREVAVASVGHVHGVPDINWYRRRTYWLRA